MSSLERCGSCAEEVPDGARFCPHCGERLAPHAPAQPSGERRQLTVMFCDLVGSTGMGQRLDPEDLKDVLSEYQQVCYQSAEKYEGHVAQLLGDGVLMYFGFPKAHEDDAERAVRTALEIQTTLADQTEAASGLPITARIGIHTGPVVLSEMGNTDHQQVLALGHTTNVAARLQGVAEPGGVVVSATTHRLIRGLFVSREMPATELRGVDQDVGIFRIERGTSVRGWAPSSEDLSPLVGRDRELQVLGSCFELVEQRHGQVVTVSGDPGIGKSRLLAAFREHLGDTDHTWLEFRCSPYARASAFQPILEGFGARFGMNPEDSSEERLDQLLTQLSALPDLDLDETVPYLAALFGVASAERFTLPQMTPEVQRAKTLLALIQVLLARSSEQPTVLVFEDLHWVDPSTSDLLARLVDEVEVRSVLVLMTHRPEFNAARETDRSHFRHFTLTPLSGSDARSLISAAPGSAGLSDELLDQLAERSDGVPLFAEELVRALLGDDSGADGSERDGSLSAPRSAIPLTLQDSLMARLDRLASAKHVAQLAATLGREFPFPLLVAVSEMDETDLRAALEQLTAAEILSKRGNEPESVYTFKHALLQDTAYDSLLKSRRRQIHAHVADTVEEHFPSLVASEPQSMARHCSLGGQTEKAIQYFQMAAEQALQRLANTEAISYFAEALKLLQELPEDESRHQREIGLQVALSAPLGAVRGFEAPALVEALHRVELLVEKLGEGPQQLPGLVGLSLHHMKTGLMQEARRHADSILRIAEPLGIPALDVAGHMIVGSASIMQATVPEACMHLSKAIELAPGAELPTPSAAYDSDVESIAHSTYAIALVLAGKPSQAQSHMSSARARAHRLGHIGSLASCLVCNAITHYFLDDHDATRAAADECLSLVGGLGYHTPEAGALVFGGWARVMSDDLAGMEQVEQGLDRGLASGAMSGLVQLCLTAADAAIYLGDYPRARELMSTAHGVMEKTGEHYAFGPQFPMFEANILIETGGDEGEIERLLHRSIDLWHRFESKWMELRSVLLLARVARTDPARRSTAQELQRLCAVFGGDVELGRLRLAHEAIERLSGP